MSIVVNKTRLPVTQWQTESGSVVSVNDARMRNAKSLSVALDPIQSGSGDPSPNNIRPISGHSSVTAVRDGKNLLDSTLADIVVGTILGTTGKNSSSTNRLRTNGYIPIKPDVTYITSYAGNIGKSFCHYYDASKAYLGNSGWVNKGASFTSPSKVAFVRIVFGKSNDGTVSVDDIANVQLELGSATAYEPFQGISVTLSLGQTVYGCTVDLVSGVMTVDTYAYDLANYTESVAVVGNGDNRYFRFDELPIYPTDASSYCISDKYVNANVASTSTDVGVRIGKASAINHRSIFFRPENPANYNATTIKSFITDTLGGLTVCYKIDPLVIQLTPTQIEMLMRENTVWSDAGLVTLNYARIRQ